MKPGVDLYWALAKAGPYHAICHSILYAPGCLKTLLIRVTRLMLAGVGLWQQL